MIAAREKYYVFLTLFFTGAAIMVIELMGTRVIGPYYGVSLYVWSSLISVALVALAVGYWLGGKVADKALIVGEETEVKREQAMRATRLMYRLILAAGVSIILVPALANSVLKATTPLGIKAGALVSSFILFTVPLLILGMITPYAIKVLTDKLKVVGTTAGNLFAISTVGSFMGTMLTGFVFMPNVGTRKVFYIQAALLIGIWAVWEVMEKKYAPSLLALPLVGFCLMSVLSADKLAEAGGFRVVDKTESFYGQLKVIDRDNKRWLSIDGAGHTGINKNTGLSLFPYAYYLEIMNFMRPEAKNALVIGLGGGSVTSRFEGYGLSVDSIEINQKVVDIARGYFGFNTPEEKVFIQDGRTYILNTKKKYDIVILDVLSGSDAPPFHLLSKEMFEEVRAVLSDDGVFGINCLSFREGRGVIIPASVDRTLKEVFPNVRAFSTVKEDVFGNTIFVASEGDLALRRELEGCEIEGVCKLLAEMMEKEVKYAKDQGIVITDDYNPVDAWGVMISEAFRKDIRAFLPAEVLAL